MTFYFPKACPSFVERPLGVPVREGFISTNASVTVHDGQIFAVVNAIDQYVNFDGVFVPVQPDQNRRVPATNLMYLCGLNLDLSVVTTTELHYPEVIATPWKFRGLECPRLFSWRGSLWVAACSHGASDMPGSKFFVGRVERDCLVGVREMIPPNPAQFEKNWMPEVRGNELRYHYRLGTLISPDGGQSQPGGRSDLSHLHGGTQVIPHHGGGVGAVHDYLTGDEIPRTRSVQHFIRFDTNGAPVGISERVRFSPHASIEVATGMAYHPDGDVLVSYGRNNSDPIRPFQERPFIAKFTQRDFGRLPYDDRART